MQNARISSHPTHTGNGCGSVENTINLLKYQNQKAECIVVIQYLHVERLSPVIRLSHSNLVFHRISDLSSVKFG